MRLDNKSSPGRPAPTGTDLDQALAFDRPDGLLHGHRRRPVPGHQVADRGQPVAGLAGVNKGTKLRDNADGCVIFIHES